MPHAYLIDPSNKTISLVHYDGKLKTAYSLIQCTMVEAKRITEAGDFLFFDEEGMLKDYPGPFFKLGSFPHPIAVRALVVGPEKTRGEDSVQLDTTLPLALLTQAVKWLTDAEAVSFYTLASAGMQANAAIGNARDRDRGVFHIHAPGPTLRLDEHGKATTH